MGKKRVVALVLVLIVMMIGSLLFAAGAKETGEKKPTFVMVPKLVHPFYEPCIEGFQDAGAKYGVNIEVESPPKLDIALQVKVIEDLIARGVDGIAISAVDNKGLMAVIDEAIAAGIKVICFDADAPDTNRATYIGTVNKQAGVTAAEYLFELMGGKGNMAIIQGGLTPNLNERQEGIREAAAKSNVKVIAFEDYHADFAEGVDKTEALLETYPELDAIFGVEAYGAPVAATVLKEQGRAGEIIVGGFDDLAETITGIKDGSVHFCLVQKAYKMGWMSVEILLDMMNGKEIPKVIDTGVIIVNKDNVDSYMAQVKAELQQ
ncbi:MAG: sugar-binding protein [Sphaerochaetaceae bacterium]|jgi:ribose transport system substrate-binding protein|nr:sugar-binding protein [Sphaerochaetaceae bacterium]NLO61377.1 substrate-binding domain-containing protein [Spirochaetales bacterium]MDD2405127.1 sugar-binding protein [Sphaerochaetaceae bacterium]MDD3671074.1 sugar-binding protein [Sphaerochaetaceae bacterium]MDD4258921.1 sugar-binding protein [Sphaerochaetaceae bacterium]